MKNNKYRRHLIRSLLLVSILICMCLTSCNGGKKKEPEKPKEPEHVCEFGEWDLILMPTCSEKGLSRRYCECGKIDEYENPPISHELVTVDGKAPSCTEDGYSEYSYCSLCGFKTEKKTLPAAHDLISEEGKPATCTEEGYLPYEHCSKCDYTTFTVVERALHQAVQVPGKAPSCTEAGFKDYEYCPNCDYTTFESIKETGHSLNSEQRLEPTCETKGFEAYEYCTVCDYTTFREINELGHDLLFVQPKEPTCTESGHPYYEYCKRCDHTTFVELPPRHSLTTVPSKAPTCTAVGWDEYQYCTACDYTEYVELPMATHSLVEVGALEPSCETGGHKKYEYCTNCSYTTYESVEKLGHSKKTEEAKAPTCTEIGWEAYEYCTKCDYTTYKELSPAHSKASVPAKSPTCNDPGWNAYEYCTKCDYTTYEEVQAVDHTYSLEWIVDVAATPETFGEMSHHCIFACGERTDVTAFEYYSEGLVFTLVSDGYAVSVGTAIGDIYIPSKYLGLSVTSVASFGFEGAEIDSIRLPNGLLRIEEGAFKNAKVASREVALPDSLLLIGSYVFDGSNVLVLDFGASCPELPIMLGPLSNLAAVRVDSLEVWLDLPVYRVSVLTAGGHLIVNGEELTDAVIPEGVKVIENQFAFVNISHLNSVTVHKDVTLFKGNFNKLYFDGTLKEWCESDRVHGCEYSELIIGGEKIGPELVIPEGVTRIRSNAFKWIELTSVSLPDSLVSIGGGAFYDAMLSELTIPEGVTSIGTEIIFGAKEDFVLHYNAVNAAGSDIFGIYVKVSVVIGDKVEKIAEGIFRDTACGVTFSYSGALKEIGASSFESYSTVNHGAVIIPSSLTKIGEGAFSLWKFDWVVNTSSAEYSFEYGIPVSKEAPRYVDDFVFLNCGEKWLLVDYLGDSDSVSLPELSGVAEYIYAPREGCMDNVRKLYLPACAKIENESFSYYPCLEELTVMSPPEGFSLSNSNSIRKITLGEGLVEVPYGAFANCENLSSVTFGDGLERIGGCAFESSHNLTTLVLPASVYYIEDLNGSNVLYIFSKGKEAPENANDYYLANKIYYSFSEMISENGFFGYADSEGKAHIISYSGSASGLVISTLGTYPVTEICERAFDGNAELVEIAFADSVERIGESAFRYCGALYSVKIGTGMKEICGSGADAAFSYSFPRVITNYSKLDIKLNDGAFGEIAYYANTLITDGYVSTIEKYGDFTAVDGVITSYDGVSADPVLNYNGSGVLYIGKIVFKTDIVSFTVNAPNAQSVVILAEAFESNASLKTVVLNAMCEISLKNEAFRGCAALETFDFSASSITAANYTFADCASLVSIGQVRPGKYTFMNCTSLTSVDWSYGSFPEGCFKGCTSLLSVKTGFTVGLESYAFDGCTALASVSFGGDFEFSILPFAFNGCTVLTEIDVKNAVCSLLAFEGCETLQKISIGEGGSFYTEWYSNVVVPSAPCLKTVDVDWNNTRTVFIDGVIYGLSGDHCSVLAILPTVSGVIDICDKLQQINLELFDDFEAVTGFVIGEGVAEISEPDRVYDSIYIPSSVSVIFDPIELMSKFRSVEVDSDNETYYSRDGVLYGITDVMKVIAVGTFASEYLIIDADTDAMDPFCFAPGNNVRVLVLPDGMKTLDLMSFDYNTESLDVLVIGSGVESVVGSVHTSLTALVNKSRLNSPDIAIRRIIDATYAGEYKILDGKYGYIALDGVITVIEYYGEKVDSLMLPENIENENYVFAADLSESDWLEELHTGGAVRIVDHCFAGCENLRTVSFDTSLEEIGYAAFAYCTAIEELFVPKSVSLIGSRAFFECISLKSISFEDPDEVFYMQQTGGISIKATFIYCPEGAAEIIIEKFGDGYIIMR